MVTDFDVIIIGAGPAGVSAAVTLRARGKATAIVSNSPEHSGLFKASKVDNYPGLPGISGSELSDKLISHARALGTEIITARVISAQAASDYTAVSFGSEVLRSRALILCIGTAQTELLPGEDEFLGKGVSYCATCDGMLYRKKRVVVCAYSDEADDDIRFLEEIGCSVAVTRSKNISIEGDTHVRAVIIEGDRTECDAVFVLRDTIAPAAILPGLSISGGAISINSAGETNLPRVFAAGDCTGAPKQIAKAVGEGQIAAFSALKLL